MDYFDHLPDPLILQIFNSVSDIKALARCRAVSRRFATLVPQSDSLLLRVDRVVSQSDDIDSLLLVSFLKTLFSSLFSSFLSPSKASFGLPNNVPNSPGRILSGFDRIRELDIELPAGDLRLHKGTVVRYKAVFGESLKSCVIFGFGGDPGGGITESLKERVWWAISVLIAASARHAYAVREVVGQHKDLVYLSLKDRDGEGEVMMDEQGLAESRESVAKPGAFRSSNDGTVVVPSVRMRMRHMKTVEVGPGLCLDGATLVVVRPSSGPPGDEEEDALLAMEAFVADDTYGSAVEKLLKGRSYMLEINSA